MELPALCLLSSSAHPLTRRQRVMMSEERGAIVFMFITL